MSIRLGVVSYLNTKPLVYPFEHGLIAHDFEMHYDVPSVCARKLHAGESDVALIPAIEMARGPVPYRIVPGVGIASRGPVRSVFLVLNQEPGDVRSVAMDTGSRTSVGLSRILLERHFGATIEETFEADPDVDAMLARADAALVIGDAALELDVDRYRLIDLGAAWTAWTGLPFVYACWTGRPDAIDDSGCERLREAGAVGLAHVDAIAEAYARDHSHTASFYAGYLTQSIVFEIGESELEGLRRYLAYAAEMKLIDGAPDLRFFGEAGGEGPT